MYKLLTNQVLFILLIIDIFKLLKRKLYLLTIHSNSIPKFQYSAPCKFNFILAICKNM